MVGRDLFGRCGAPWATTVRQNDAEQRGKKTREIFYVERNTVAFHYMALLGKSPATIFDTKFVIWPSQISQEPLLKTLPYVANMCAA